MEIGKMVKMKIYGGESILMVVETTDTHVNVCTKKEFENAKKEKRRPVLVGFPKTDIIDEVQ
jgi:hypothetical protein